MLNVQVNNPRTLDTAIRAVAKFADTSKTALDVTQQIHIETIDNGLRLTATNLTESVSYAMNTSQVHEAGDFCINAKNLLGLAKLVKGQEPVTLAQTEKGVDVRFSDAPNFRATYCTLPTGDFPALRSDFSDATMEFTLTPENVKALKTVIKYTRNDAYRMGLDCVQFHTQDGVLTAMGCNGNELAYTHIGETDDTISVAIPADTLKKAFQVATGELGKSDWTLRFVPYESVETNFDVLAIDIDNTRIISHAGEFAANVFEVTGKMESETDTVISLDYKALAKSLKPLTKVFSKDKTATNLLTLHFEGGATTLTAQCYKDGGHWNEEKQRYFHVTELDDELVHTFKAHEAIPSAPTTLHLNPKAFAEQVKSFAKSKPERITIAHRKQYVNMNGDPAAPPIVISVDGAPVTYIAQTSDADVKKVRGY